jgi:hypothetical protein
LGNGSTARWSPNRWVETYGAGSQRHFSIERFDQGLYPGLRMVFELSEIHDNLADAEHFKRRLICYLLLSEIPEKGLTEALESLLEIRHFYQETPLQIPDMPKLPSIPVQVGKTYVRPEFHISED